MLYTKEREEIYLEWVEILLVLVLFVTIIDILNNWRLYNGFSGKSTNEINAELQRIINKLDFITSTQMQRSRQLDDKLTRKISALKNKISDMQTDINTILETYKRFSNATTAIKIYTLYLDAMTGNKARIKEFMEYVDTIPDELLDLKSFANELKAKLKTNQS